jgi:hypothetical protein
LVNNSLTIGFLLGSPDINGGTYVIFEHASRLKDFGHRVSIITQDHVEPERYSWHPSAGQLAWLTFEEATSQNFDIAVATWWQSPFLLNRLSASQYIYFVQSVESRFFQEENPQEHDERELSLWRDFCESTYSYNMPVITEAHWIQEYLSQRYNNTAYLVRNGIRKDIYRKDGDAVSEHIDGQLRVLVEGPVDVLYKNVPKSIELCRKAGVDEVWLLTSSDVQSFPGVDRVFSRVSIHDTPAIYRSCDVLVKLSYIEGMFGPPLEMFHCGGTTIVYEVTGHDEYIVHDQNGLVVEKDDENRIVEYLKKLKDEPDYLLKLKQGAEATAQGWPDWGESSAEFANVLGDITSNTQPVSKNYIQYHTDKLVRDRDNAFAARELQLFAEREKNYGKVDKAADNFIQLYWHEGDHFSQDRCQCFHYVSGIDIMATFELAIHRFPFWIRIDPSVRIGVVILHSIKITNKNSTREVMSFHHPGDFDAAMIDGTVSRIAAEKGALYFSHGSDPQLILPPIERGNTEDVFRVEISLKEMGFHQFVGEQCLAGRRGKGGIKIPAAISRLFERRNR